MGNNLSSSIAKQNAILTTVQLATTFVWLKVAFPAFCSATGMKRSSIFGNLTKWSSLAAVNILIGQFSAIQFINSGSRTINIDEVFKPIFRMEKEQGAIYFAEDVFEDVTFECFNKPHIEVTTEQLIEELKKLPIQQTRKKPVVEPPKEEQEIEDDIETIKKENVFSEKVTEKEKTIISQRVELQKKKFNQFTEKENYNKMKKISDVYNWLTKEEMEAALKYFNNNEDEVILELTSEIVLRHFRKQIAQKTTPNTINSNVPNTIQKKVIKTLNMNPREKTGERIFKKLRLDEALKTQDDFSGWSPARITAFQQKDQNPNAYYYRFNDPNENQRNGKWSKDEHKKFMERVEEFKKLGKANKDWGIFAQTIPGRVGYQCSNYYRQLLVEGKLFDERYFIGQDGKAHFIRANGKFTKTENNKQLVTATEEKEGKQGNKYFFPEEVPNLPQNIKKTKPKPKAKPKSKKRKFEAYDSSSDSEDEFEENVRFIDEEEKIGDQNPPKKRKIAYHNVNDQVSSGSSSDSEDDGNNPLPGFIDPITLDEISKPAISPLGYVMGYKSWSRCLTSEPKNICPLTKTPLKKRELVILTWENIEQYKSKIANSE